jgi:hypothetical protein
MGLAEIRAGLAAALVAGLDSSLKLAVYERIPDRVDPPCAIIGLPDGVTYHQAFRSTKGRYLLPVRVLLPRGDGDDAQRRLDAMASPSGSGGVLAALEADGTLGGACDTLMVKEVRGWGVYEVAGAQYLGAEWMVEVIG